MTNPKRLKDGIAKKAANAILIKVNQIGSLSETREAIHMAKAAKFHTVMSIEAVKRKTSPLRT